MTPAPTSGPKTPPRALGTGALLASVALALSYGLLGLNSVAVARIAGPSATGLLALSTQVVFMAIFLAGLGLRTGAATLISAGRWAPRDAARRLAGASFALGLAGGLLGMGVYLLARHGALEGLDATGAAALMVSLPFALAWWTLPAIALALDRYESYALLTIANPVATLVLCPAGAVIGGGDGAVVGLAAGQVAGGVVALGWAARFVRRTGPQAEEDGPHREGEEGLPGALRIGLRGWVNDLFQIVNLRPDLFILNAYGTTAQVGVYGVAVTVTSLAWILAQSLATVVLPRSAALRAEGGAASEAGADPLGASGVRHGVLVSAAVSLVIGVVLFAVPLVWGPAFHQTVELGLILLPGVAALGVGRVMVASFTGLGHNSYALLVGVVSLPLTVVAYLLVIPGSGETGAAVVSTASYLVTSLLAAVLYARATGLRPREFLVPRSEDLRDYGRFARRIIAAARDRRAGARGVPR